MIIYLAMGHHRGFFGGIWKLTTSQKRHIERWASPKKNRHEIEDPLRNNNSSTALLRYHRVNMWKMFSMTSKWKIETIQGGGCPIVIVS